jgi:hypothetical protein
MADTQKYRVKGHLGPVDTFFDSPSKPVIKIASAPAHVPTSTVPHHSRINQQHTPSLNHNRVLVHSTIGSISSSLAIVPSSPSPIVQPSSFSNAFETPFPTFLPGVVYTGDQQARKDQDTKFREDSSQQQHHKMQHHINWFYPLLAVLGVLALLTLAIYFYVEKKRRRASIAPHRHIKWNPDENNSSIPRYPSWSSYSATTVIDKSVKINAPPPVYTSKEEKRLTSDTLVEPASVAMLKTQYSPQLAFSPSLVAGEFPQQQQQESFPTELQQANKLGISPSNTLIDNASIISDKNQQRPRIEIYEPQVNLPDDDDTHHLALTVSLSNIHEKEKE